VFQFGLMWLFAFIAIISSLLGLAKIDLQAAFWATCILMPLFFAVFARHGLFFSDYVCVAVVIVSCMITGAALAAFGSYYFTFVERSEGFLVGGGWQSVFGATLFGCLASAMPGVIALVLYQPVSTAVGWFVSPATKNKQA
jgi:hypothetical protein